MVGGVINHYLKLTFKQPRPERSKTALVYCLKYVLFYLARDRMGFYEVHGMPSAHAQSFFYFMTYLAIFVILK